MFKIVTGDLDSFVKNATTIHNDFDYNIKRLENLVSTMEVSDAWRDNILKASYIAACKSHIARFKGISKVMNGDIKYARSKAQRAEELTNIYKS
jgi:hypothetical protein